MWFSVLVWSHIPFYFSLYFPLHRCKNALEKLSHLSGIKEHSIHGNKLTFELLSPGDSQVTGLLTLHFSQGRHPSAPWQLSNAEVRVQVDCKGWQVHIGSLYGDYSELSICTTDDSRTFGMSVSFMWACVKFVIHRSSQFYNTQRTWQRLMFYCRRTHPSCKSKAHHWLQST